MKQYHKYIKQVENCLTANAPNKLPVEVDKLAAYIGTKQKVLGLDTPLQKQLAKKGYDLSIEKEQLLLFYDSVFRTTSVFEIKNTALLFLEYNFSKISKNELLQIIPDWVNYVDNWAHSDYLSKFYTRFIEDEATRKLFFPVLKKWNEDPDPWKRRQSMVALMYYSRMRTNHLPFKTIISFVEPHLDAMEYYVQKGLGWTLRECYNVYPDLTYKFINEKFERISSVAFTAACEKMRVKEKEKLKEKRKLYRNKRTRIR